jgi:hypothetical protein
VWCLKWSYWELETSKEALNGRSFPSDTFVPLFGFGGASGLACGRLLRAMMHVEGIVYCTKYFHAHCPGLYGLSSFKIR